MTTCNMTNEDTASEKLAMPKFELRSICNLLTSIPYSAEVDQRSNHYNLELLNEEAQDRVPKEPLAYFICKRPYPKYGLEQEVTLES